MLREALSTDTIALQPHQLAFSIILYSPANLSQLLEKLFSLDCIYSNLCKIADPQVENSLEIINIESGSLWARFFGESRIVTLMIDLIRAAVAFFHRNYTREGKRRSLPESAEAIYAVIELERRLAELGFNTSEMRHNIENASASISKNLNTLLQDEPFINLNGEIYPVNINLDRRDLQENIALTNNTAVGQRLLPDRTAGAQE